MMTPIVQLVWVLVLGLAIRLALAPIFGGYGYDMGIFRNWATTLTSEPRSSFYAVARAPDHLPGDLWIMEGAARVFLAVGGEIDKGIPFRILIKLVPFIADLLTGLAIFQLVGTLGRPDLAVLAGAMYFLNPAVIYISAVWGQWDSVSSLFLLIALLIVLHVRSGGWVLAAPFMTWAILIKPQLVLISLLICVIPVSRSLRGSSRQRPDVGTIIGQYAIAAILGLAWLLALIVPFDVGLPGIETRWSLIDRTSIALDLYPVLTMGAANVWMIDVGSLQRFSDITPEFLGVTAYAWGTFLLTAGLAWTAIACLLWIRRGKFADALLWAAVAASWCVFMLPTRVHERYLFPAIVFGVLFVAVRGFRHLELRLFWIGNGLFLINLMVVYGGFSAMMSEDLATSVQGALLRGVAIGNLAMFALVMTLPAVTLRHQSGASIQTVK